MKCRFGDNLQDVRWDKNISQKELAERLSVNKSTVSKWESGKVYPSIYWIYKIASVLGVNPKDLV